MRGTVIFLPALTPGLKYINLQEEKMLMLMLRLELLKGTFLPVIKLRKKTASPLPAVSQMLLRLLRQPITRR